VALRDAHAQGASPEESVRQGLRLTSPAIVLGAVTTTLATGVLVFVPQPGALDMGLTATLGLAVSLLVMLSFLPAAWLLVERRWSHAEPPARMVLPGLHAAATFSVRHPRIVLLLSLLLLALGLGGLPRYEMETDLKHIMSRDVRAAEVDVRIKDLYGIAPVSYVVPVGSIEEARTLAARMLRQPDVVAITSPADWVRDDAAARAERMRQAVAGAGSRAAASTASPSSLAGRLETALRLGPIELADVPLAFRSGTMGEDGSLALQIIPRAALLDSKAIEAQVHSLRQIAPELTGIPVVALMLMAGERDWIPIVLATITFIVIGVLAVSFRNVRDVILAFLPVVVGSVVSMGVFFLLDLRFSILTGIVVPVIVGLGVDDGIHIVERLRHLGGRDDATIIEAVESVGRAIFLTSATTTVSFIGLFFCNHYGLESMAQFMSMAMPLCFLASVTVLPAAVVLLRPRPKPADALASDPPSM
jgi:predicted RND superfamily exporter protein